MLVHGGAADGARAQGLVGKFDQLARFLARAVVAEVELQLEVARLFVAHDGHLGGEGPAGLGAEALQRADAALAQQGLGLGGLEGAARGRFGEREAAAGRVPVGARAGIAAVVLLDHAAAVGARRGQRGVVAGDGVAVVFLGLLDHALGHGGDLLHEGLAAELALFHLGELVFPLAGEFGAREFFHAQAAQQGHELEGLGGGDQLAALAQHVFFGEQAFDDGRARGRGAQALFLHGRAQLFVFHLLAGAFHGAEQRGFGVARGRLGLEGLGLGVFGVGHLAGPHGHQRLALVAFLAALDLVRGLLAVDGEPAGLDQHLALGLEAVAHHLADAGRDHVFGAGEEHGHEAAHHQVVELLLGLREAAGRLRGRDDGEVVADLAVVEDALGGAHVVVVQRLLRVGREVAHAAGGQHAEGVLGHGQVVFRQGARVGPRVGQGLVALVEALGQGQRGLGREAELAVGLALQAGQVEQQRRCLGGGLAFLGDGGRLAAHGVGDLAGALEAPDTVGAGLGVVALLLPLRVEPLAEVFAGLGVEAGVDFPVVAAHELADLFLALDDQRERGGLHAAHGGEEEAAVARVERRHGARAVDAHEPVGLGAAARGAGQALHLLVGAQVVEAVADGLRGHGLQPEAPHGLAQGPLGTAGVLLDEAEDQLALAARVAGVDEVGDVLALGEPHHRAEAALGLVHRFEVEIRRDHRQVREAPLAALDVEFLGRLDLHEVAHGAGDDIAVVLEVVFVLVELARHGGERAHDVLRHRGFFCDYQGLGHFLWGLPRRALLQFRSLTRRRARACACVPIQTNRVSPCPAPPRTPPTLPPPGAGAASRCAARGCTARACSRCRTSPRARCWSNTRARSSAGRKPRTGIRTIRSSRTIPSISTSMKTASSMQSMAAIHRAGSTTAARPTATPTSAAAASSSPRCATSARAKS
ncbi:hypothetical protein ACAN107058_22940 [Paracidovorax anthurii]